MSHRETETREAPAAASQHARPSAWAAVAVGGLVGTELRYLLGLLVPESPMGIPVTTLMINVVGSFVLGFLSTYWVKRPGTPFWLRAALGPGILGSFTTFSAVVLSTDQLAAHDLPAVALAYLGLSLLLGLGAAAAGYALGKREAR